MAGMSNKVKLAWLKGMEAIGNGASNMANSAHDKVAEINLESRRREILSEFPMRAFDLWQKGVELPAPLGDMMAELGDLDQRLSVLRAQRYARLEENGGNAAKGAPKCEAADADVADAAAADATAADGESGVEAQAGACAEDENAADTADAPAQGEADATEESACCERLHSLLGSDGENGSPSGDTARANDAGDNA